MVVVVVVVDRTMVMVVDRTMVMVVVGGRNLRPLPRFAVDIHRFLELGEHGLGPRVLLWLPGLGLGLG